MVTTVERRLRDRTKPVTITAEVDGQPRTYEADFVIFATQAQHIKVFGDTTPLEDDIFGALRSTQLVATTYTTQPNPERRPVQVFPDYIRRSRLGGRALEFDLLRAVRPHEGVATQNSVGKSLLVGYQFYPEYVAPAAFRTLLDRARPPPEQLLEQIAAEGYLDPAVLDGVSREHNPRFTPEAIQESYPWKLLAMQGRHRTWFIGSSVSFESIEDVIAYNHLLLETSGISRRSPAALAAVAAAAAAGEDGAAADAAKPAAPAASHPKISKLVRLAQEVQPIPDFEGEIYVRDQDLSADPNSPYNLHRYQYALSSHLHLGSMEPALVLYPKGDADIARAIAYATKRDLAIAVRSGGHQYSGASSTNGDNVQIDLSETFQGEEDFFWDESTSTARVGVSFHLGEFARRLAKCKAFVPTGQCTHVHIGGHAQTGGYGAVSRGHGLLVDYVLSFEIWMADGVKRTISKDTDPELFFALRGGSPGNFGVITHVTFRCLRDHHHPKSRGFCSAYPYSKEAYQKLTEIIVEAASDDTFPHDFDFNITCLSFDQIVLEAFPTLDLEMRRQFWEVYSGGESRKEEREEKNNHPKSILLQAYWSNTGGPDQEYDPSFFAKLKKVVNAEPWFSLITDDAVHPMSELMLSWIFPLVREFQRPFFKMVVISDSKTLREDGFAEWYVDRLEKAQHTKGDLKISSQFQVLGGHLSSYRLQDDGSSAISFRKDYPTNLTFDVFYKGNREEAHQFHLQTLKEAVGPLGRYCKEDKRFIWGSFETTNLDEDWAKYFDSREKYDRLCATKSRTDPSGMFTPNGFCVGGPRKRAVYPTVTPADAAPVPKSPARELQIDDAAHTARIKARYQETFGDSENN